MHLQRREAIRGIRALAQQYVGIEVALRRVAEEAVLYAVRGVAGGERSALDRGQFSAGDIVLPGRCVPWETLSPAGEHARPGIRGRTGEDSVVVLGKALRLHQCLAASVGARVEVGLLDRVAVISLDHVLGPQRGQVNGAPTKILDLFRVVQRPARVLGAALVARIGAGGSEPAAEIAGQALVPDGARQTHHCPRQESDGSNPSPATTPQNGYRNPGWAGALPVTRQNTGKSCKGFSIPGPSRLPEVTRSAVAMVVSASFSCFSALQSAAKSTDVEPSRPPSSPMTTGAKPLCCSHSSDCSLGGGDYIGHHEIPDETHGPDPTAQHNRACPEPRPDAR